MKAQFFLFLFLSGSLTSYTQKTNEVINPGEVERIERIQWQRPESGR